MITGLTTTDLIAEINVLDDSGAFVVGSGQGEIPVAALSDALARSEEGVLSALPENYAKLTREIVGELVVRSAAAGQTTFTLSIAPVTAGTVFLYKNYTVQSRDGDATEITSFRMGTTRGRRSYANRMPQDRLPAAQWSLNATTGEVTLTTGLVEGDTIAADYEHTGLSGCSVIRDWILKHAAAEIVRRMPSVSAEAYQNATTTQQQIRADLIQLADGVTGLNFFDRLTLMPEYETRQAGSTLRFPMLGGW